jgi:hypothetical protein
MRWTGEQACAWAIWHDAEMVARAETATVQQLLAEWHAARRRALWYGSPIPLPAVGSQREFRLAVAQGRLLPAEDGRYDAAEVQTVFPLGVRRLGLESPAPKRRGPAPGKLDRYGASDRALFDELEQLMRDRMISSTAAAKILADQEKVAGIGTTTSCAKRLAERYRRERECRN